MPPVYRFRFRLADERSLHDSALPNRFAGLFYRLFWGGTSDRNAAEVWEGTVAEDGTIARDLDGSSDFGVLDVGVTDNGTFTAYITIPLQRTDPPGSASEGARERKELFRRLYNLGYAITADVPGLVAAIESSEDFEAGGLPYQPLVDALDRYVFRHYYTAANGDQERYGPIQHAGTELTGGRRPEQWRRLVDDVRRLHDERR